MNTPLKNIGIDINNLANHSTDDLYEALSVLDTVADCYDVVDETSFAALKAELNKRGPIDPFVSQYSGPLTQVDFDALIATLQRLSDSAKAREAAYWAEVKAWEASQVA